MAYATAADVFRIAGINSDVVANTDVDEHIREAEGYIDNYFNTSFETKSKTVTLDGNGFNYMYLPRYPVQSVTTLNVNGTSVTPSKLFIYKDDGRIVLKSDAEVSSFDNSLPQTVAVTFVYGYNYSFSGTIDSEAYFIRKLASVIAGISILTQQVGGTFDDVTAYQLPEFQASKGEPWTNIIQTVMKLQTMYDNMIISPQAKAIARNAYFG
jgi:hypothetical protein